MRWKTEKRDTSIEFLWPRGYMLEIRLDEGPMIFLGIDTGNCLRQGWWGSNEAEVQSVKFLLHGGLTRMADDMVIYWAKDQMGREANDTSDVWDVELTWYIIKMLFSIVGIMICLTCMMSDLWEYTNTMHHHIRELRRIMYVIAGSSSAANVTGRSWNVFEQF